MIARVTVSKRPPTATKSKISSFCACCWLEPLAQRAFEQPLEQFSAGSGTALLRITPAGTLDASFSGDGIHVIDEVGRKLAHQPDGKIIVLGNNAEGCILSRYFTDGVLGFPQADAAPAALTTRLFSDHVEVDLPLAAAAEATWEVWDVAGRRMGSGASSGKISFGLTGLSAGSYQIRVLTGPDAFSARFVVP